MGAPRALCLLYEMSASSLPSKAILVQACHRRGHPDSRRLGRSRECAALVAQGCRSGACASCPEAGAEMHRACSTHRFWKPRPLEACPATSFCRAIDPCGDAQHNTVRARVASGIAPSLRGGQPEARMPESQPPVTAREGPIRGCLRRCPALRQPVTAAAMFRRRRRGEAHLGCSGSRPGGRCLQPSPTTHLLRARRLGARCSSSKRVPGGTHSQDGAREAKSWAGAPGRHRCPPGTHCRSRRQRRRSV